MSSSLAWVRIVKDSHARVISRLTPCLLPEAAAPRGHVDHIRVSIRSCGAVDPAAPLGRGVPVRVARRIMILGYLVAERRVVRRSWIGPWLLHRRETRRSLAFARTGTVATARGRRPVQGTCRRMVG